MATMRDLERSSELRKACADAGLDIDVNQLDVKDADSIESAVQGAIARHGRIDVLVNNAGYGFQGAVEATTIDQARALFDTNVFGVMRVTQAVLPYMRAHGSGVIINISSLAAIATNPFSGVYSASKRAIEAISEALHYEVSPFGIRVAIIEPGSFPTEFGEKQSALGDTAAAYADRLTLWNEAYGRLPGRDEPADPSLVAEVVFEAATDANFPLRRLVGSDAEMIAALRAELDDANFEATVRSYLNFWD